MTSDSENITLKKLSNDFWLFITNLINSVPETVAKIRPLTALECVDLIWFGLICYVLFIGILKIQKEYTTYR